MNKPLIECKHFPGKCFGCIQICGKYYCKVLDTEIKDHSCPFYKTQVEYDLQIPHSDRQRFDYIDDVIERMINDK